MSRIELVARPDVEGAIMDVLNTRISRVKATVFLPSDTCHPESVTGETGQTRGSQHSYDHRVRWYGVPG